MPWTTAQQKVIDIRNKNLLVSAAAGSGKTAVLVERIVSMISEGEHPVDIDHLLVVTFTNAAAAEMRSRIGEAIDRKLSLKPDNLHLQKQLSLLQSAQITTIHSFCLNVIRNYFHCIDLDPSFKIAEESEITLMKSDVVARLLERWYEEGREDFHAFVESYSYSKSDAPLEELILQLYDFSMSAPWPKLWIEEKRNQFEPDSLEALSKAPWMQELTAYSRTVLVDLLDKNKQAISLCAEADGPAAYEPALLSDRGLLQGLLGSGSYEEYAESFLSLSFARLSGKKQEGVPGWKKDKVKALREEVKKGIKELEGQFFFQPPEEMLADLQAARRTMGVLFELTLEFMEEFAGKKEEKNLIDFNDLEHFALKILVKDDAPTQAALELSEQYEEILIDEYQDSNLVQETILKSISKERNGTPNRFMVGDVKQSIYKFRLAMPEIFMEKYETYPAEELTEEGQTNLFQRIDLDKNFRSRKTVLDYVNTIFEQIMQKSVGGIIYDEAASLKYGELFEETLKNEDNASCITEDTKARLAAEVELLFVTEEEVGDLKESQQDKASQEAPEDTVYTKKEIEARAIVRKIRELTKPDTGMLVFDSRKKCHRPAQYKDIVILLRSMSGWAEVFVNTLMQEGIPAYADTGTGYFQTLEIMTILNMLRIIDNPRQDIPLTGVLYSPMVGMNSTELAMIRASSRSGSMYTALQKYAKEGSQEELRGKAVRFTEMLSGFRLVVNHKPIHELIQLVLEQTGYYYYVSAMPGGDQRKANMDMLIAQAVRFEKGSYSGLFHFIRYIEKLNKYEVDFGEASASGEQDDTVRIMSIHKSKGLEFPIVFVAGMSKQFNTQDIRNSIVLHHELGAGPEYIDCEHRTKVPTLLKKVIQKKVQIENIGEELRVLYVAMTRAKEKLILTGYLKTLEDIQTGDFSFYELMSAKSYLDWILPATINRTGWNPVYEEEELIYRGRGALITVVPRRKLLNLELTKQLFLRKDKGELLQIGPGEIYDEAVGEKLRSSFDYAYPYQKEAAFKVKMTVSELKKLGQYEKEEQGADLLQTLRQGAEKLEAPAEPALTVPNFISRNETALSGTDRGTLYHKVLELLDLQRVDSSEKVEEELARLVREGLQGSEVLSKIRLDYIRNFVTSSVAGRMRKAQQEGKLYKEQQFVMGIQAKEVVPDSESEEQLLLQGIIDVFFEEDGELVLLDYKSDLVTDGEQLIKRYRVQLNYYCRALEQIRGKRVKEKLIYSLALGKEIRID
jgi:ATP-dependent helicase/nuclease subunit A